MQRLRRDDGGSCGSACVVGVGGRPPGDLDMGRPPQATHYELEAGSALGLRNLAKLTVGSTSHTVDNVPAGTYYVRVRALNYAGKGAYTEDVKVVVP